MRTQRKSITAHCQVKENKFALVEEEVNYLQL